MKRFKSLIFCVSACLLLFSCSKVSQMKENSKNAFVSMVNEMVKDPSSLKIDNITYVFASDSLAIIHADVTAKNGLGIENTQKYEYIYINRDSLNYEGFHSKSSDSIYLSKETYEEIRKGTIYESLPYENGIYYLAALYINSYGRVVGDKANKSEVNLMLPTKTGYWSLNYNLNEFGERTDERYLTLVGRGLFSNSATTNSNMYAILFITRNNYLIRLIEYGSHVVKDDCAGTFRVKDSEGTIYSGRFKNSQEGYMSYSSFSEDLNFYNLATILKKGGDLIFSGTLEEYTTSRYVFTFKTDGFENAYNYLLSEKELERLKKEQSFIDDIKKTDPMIEISETGLAYKIINQGEDPKPKDSDWVKAIYEVKSIDGAIFDSSKGKPKNLPIKGVVPGLAEGLKLLGKGGKAILYIPGNLGYKEQGHPTIGIEPNQTLIFEVEVTDISNEMPEDFMI